MNVPKQKKKTPIRRVPGGKKSRRELENIADQLARAKNAGEVTRFTNALITGFCGSRLPAEPVLRKLLVAHLRRQIISGLIEKIGKAYNLGDFRDRDPEFAEVEREIKAAKNHRKSLPGLRKVLTILSGLPHKDPLFAAVFLINATTRLDDRSPIEALRDGDKKSVAMVKRLAAEAIE